MVRFRTGTLYKWGLIILLLVLSSKVYDLYKVHYNGLTGELCTSVSTPMCIGTILDLPIFGLTRVGTYWIVVFVVIFLVFVGVDFNKSRRRHVSKHRHKNERFR